MSAWTPQTFRWWYDSLIDWLIANPTKTQRDAAAHFGRTPISISLVMKSDLFRARYQQRRQEVNAKLADGVATALTKTALSSLEIISKRLEEEPAKIPTITVLDVASRTLQALGYGPKPVAGPTNATQVNITVGKDVLAEARNKMLENEQLRIPARIVDEEKVA